MCSLLAKPYQSELKCVDTFTAGEFGSDPSGGDHYLVLTAPTDSGAPAFYMAVCTQIKCKDRLLPGSN